MVEQIYGTVWWNKSNGRTRIYQARFDFLHRCVPYGLQQILWGEYFHIKFPDELLKVARSINELEALALIVGQRNSRAEGIFSNLITQWVWFLEFCIYFGLLVLPAPTIVLVWYVQYISRHLKSHQSVLSYLSGVKTFHTLLGYAEHGFAGVALRLTLAGLKRLNTHVMRQAKPITPYILRDMRAVLDLSQEEDLIFWNLCLFASFLLFRKSNLIPDTKWTFNANKQLVVDDILILNNRVVVGICWAKNHQFGSELFSYPMQRLVGCVLCLHAAITALLTKFPRQGRANLFKKSDGSAFTYPQFQAKLHWVLREAGHDDKLGGGHHICIFEWNSHRDNTSAGRMEKWIIFEIHWFSSGGTHSG